MTVERTTDGAFRDRDTDNGGAPRGGDRLERGVERRLGAGGAARDHCRGVRAGQADDGGIDEVPDLPDDI